MFVNVILVAPISGPNFGLLFRFSTDSQLSATLPSDIAHLPQFSLNLISTDVELDQSIRESNSLIYTAEVSSEIGPRGVYGIDLALSPYINSSIGILAIGIPKIQVPRSKSLNWISQIPQQEVWRILALVFLNSDPAIEGLRDSSRGSRSLEIRSLG